MRVILVAFLVDSIKRVLKGFVWLPMPWYWLYIKHALSPVLTGFNDIVAVVA